MTLRIAIAGAGISGLSTAHALKQRGHDVTIFEATDRPGGVVRTLHQNGYQIEAGPHTLLIRDAAVDEILGQLGLKDREIQPAGDAKTRYVVRNGRPVPVPMSPVDFATTSLMSPTARLRALAEPFVPAADGELDETLAAFIERRFGGEVLHYAVDPFVGGVWAGDPRTLSTRHTFPEFVEYERSAGSVLLGAAGDKLFGDDTDDVDRRLISFDGGMETMVDAFSSELTDELRLESPVRKLRRDDDTWRVIFQRGKARRGESFDAVVLAMPADAVAELEWENAAPSRDVVEELAMLPYAPCCVVGFGFSKDQISHSLDGFGVLIPRIEEFHILGALFSSSMFPQMAPDGKVQLTAFVGGTRQPELAFRDDDTVVEMALHDLRRLLGVEGSPDDTHLVRWKRAIPQYEVGHGVVLDRIDELERQLPGVFAVGNYRDGISVPDRLAAGPRQAERIVEEMT